MQHRLGILFLFAMAVLNSFSQSSANDLKFDFFGYVRVDHFFDSRQSVASNENLLFLYPKDISPDANGDDLNALPHSGMFAFNTRAGLRVDGLKLGDADVSALIEADFAGFSNSNTMLRIRRAYANAQWEYTSLLFGQDWHPLFNQISPGQISTSTGAPFQPFNRSPQIRFSMVSDPDGGVNRDVYAKVDFAAVYQFQNASYGVDGRNKKYQQQAILPELVLTTSVKFKDLLFGAGINYLTLSPRSQYEWNGGTYKADETLHSFATTCFIQYQTGLFSASARTTLGENMAYLNMLGGYGVRSVDEESGKRKYANLSQHSSWLNLSYGKKYKANLMLGNTYNMGTSGDKTLMEGSPLYGEGMTVQNLTRLAPSFSYNIPHFRIGIEYECSWANYGDTGSFDWSDGVYDSTHTVTNHRIYTTASYIF